MRPRSAGAVRGRVATIGLGGVAMAAVIAALLLLRPTAAVRVAPQAIPIPPAVPVDVGLTALDTPRREPSLGFIDGDGRPMTLDDFRGRAILLNVWATWCVPCRAEMPALDRLQAKMGAPDFQVVALSIDRQGLAVVEPFYRELGLKSLGIYVDRNGRSGTAINTPGIPTTLLIDRGGREIARKVGPAAWDRPEMVARIQEILQRNADAAGAAK